MQQLSVESVVEVAEIVANSLKQQDFPYKQKTNLAYCKIYNQEYFTKLLNNKENAIFGAYQGLKLAGVIVIKTEEGGVMHIDWLIVKKEFRGMGVGTLLLKEAEKWALANKLHYAYLFTETDKNIEFYKKRGFRFVGEHLNSWFGETEYALEKSLRDKPFDSIWMK
ncbi:MAG: GNAT family N-acetyltransferase [Candidatus Levyibacteriota bacterium]